MKFILSAVVTILAFAYSASAQAHNHKLTIENTSSDAIFNVYISPASRSSWGVDRLGDSGIILSGYSRYIDLLGHVSYDVKIVEEDGQFCTVRNFNLDRDMTIRNTETSCGVVGASNNYN